jgi:hypothetical protein
LDRFINQNFKNRLCKKKKTPKNAFNGRKTNSTKKRIASKINAFSTKIVAIFVEKAILQKSVFEKKI